MQLAVDNLVVGDGVALDNDVADARLLALDNPDFYIDGVILDGNLDRCGAEKQVAVVHIHRGDVGTAGIVGKVGFEHGLVVGVALLDSQVLSQQLGGIDGIAREGDVPEIVRTAFKYLDLHFHAVLLSLLACANVKVFRRYRPHGIFHDACIAISKLVVVGNNLIKVVIELELTIFGACPESFCPEEEFLGIMHIVRVLHLAKQLVGWHVIVAHDDERVNLHALAFLDVVSQYDVVVFACGVDFNDGVHLYVGESLVGIVRLCLVAGGFQHILGNHVAHMYAKICTELFCIAAAYSIEFHRSQLGSPLKDYLKENLVVLYAG